MSVSIYQLTNVTSQHLQYSHFTYVRYISLSVHELS